MHFGDRIEESGLEIITSMLSECWNVKISQKVMQLRLASGQMFFIAFDSAVQEDAEKYNAHLGEIIPVGLIETIDIKTLGSYSLVPKTYCALTEAMLWRSPMKMSDTLILTDITMLPTHRGKNIGRELVQHCLKSATHTGRYDYIWTYTPDIAKIKDWHIRNGAVDSNYKIPGAREFCSTPDVNIMDYSKHVVSIKK